MEVTRTKGKVPEDAVQILGNVPILGNRAKTRIWGNRISVRDLLNMDPFEGVTAFTGEPGSGKTAGMVSAALALHAQGWDVISNGLDLKCESYSYSSLQELSDIIDEGGRGRTVVLLDEAPFFANSRKWAEFPDQFFQKLQQVRKYNFLLLYSTINWLQVDVNLRRLTYWVWECRREKFTNRFVRELYPPEEERIAGEKARYTLREWPRKGIFEAYDTHKFLHEPKKHSFTIPPLPP